MGVYKKGKNWYIDYYHKGRRLRKRIGPSKQVAELALKDVELKIARGEFLGIYEEKRILFREFAEEFIGWAEVNTSRGTAKQYGMVIRSSLVPFFGDRYLAQITRKDVEDYKMKRAKTVKPATVNDNLTLLRGMLRRAVEWGYISLNPAQGVKRLKAPARKPRFLSREEGANLLEVAPDEWKALIAAGLYAGLRSGELMNLQWQDISMKNRTITIQPKDDWQPKNRKVRVIPISTKLLGYLQKHPRHISSPYVFCQPDGVKRSRVHKNLPRIAERVGLTNVTPHILRHTFASWLVMEGADLATVQKLLGHSDITTTMIYAHLASDHVKAAVERLNFSDGHYMDTRATGDTP